MNAPFDLLPTWRQAQADPAYIAPVVADEDRGASARFVSLAGQDTRVARLMLERAELCSALSLAEDAAVAHAARIRQLEHEVKLLRGQIEPDMPHGWSGFVFSIKLGDGVLWCLAGDDRNYRGHPIVFAMWINGAWVNTEEFNGPLAFDALDAAAAEAE